MEISLYMSGYKAPLIIKLEFNYLSEKGTKQSYLQLKLCLRAKKILNYQKTHSQKIHQHIRSKLLKTGFSYSQINAFDICISNCQ